MDQRLISSSSSFFSDLSIRELIGFRVRRRPYLGDLSSESGVVAIEHEGNSTPPLAVSFSKRISSNLLAVSDEDGYLSFYDTRRSLPSLSSCREKAAEARICDWIAHNNAIFDVCWMKDDSQILTASGDQTIKIWNVEKRKCIGVLTGHTGTLKSVCPHSTNSDLLVSGGRDGTFALWDLRCKYSSTNNHGEPRILSSAIVKEAHTSIRGKRVRRGKSASTSITSVLYLKDDISIASAGAVDSIVKFWDTRNLKSSIAQACPQTEPSNKKENVLHGISCLSQDSNGVHLTASCTDHRIYLYDVMHLSKGPTKIFSGSKIQSFYVKSAISPDGAHILGGSSDGNAYIWRVHKPENNPIKLEGHEGEVTAVDWCPSDYGKLATSSDDFTVRVWNIKKGSPINTISPTSIRKRVTARPNIECRKLFMDDTRSISKEVVDNEINPSSQEVVDNEINPSSPVQTKPPEFSTPESGSKRKAGMFLDAGIEIQKSPEASSESPSSVLNPPPSLKRRTIRDYFLSAS